MTVEEQPTRTRRPRPVSRRPGAAIGLAVDLILVILIDVWPGWWTVPVLTQEFAAALGVVNASLIVGAVGNLVLLIVDRRSVRAVVDVVSTGFALAVLLTLWNLFPFDFGSVPAGVLIARVVLGVALAGTAIAVVVQIVALVTLVLRASAGRQQ